MSRLVFLALVGAATAQPDVQCGTEALALMMGGTTVSDATCTALAEFEGCIARVTDRAAQSTLEVALSGYQTQMQGCTAAPMTAAIRTARDEVEVTGAQVVFARTVRQLVNVHELQQQVDTNEESLSATIASVEAAVTSTLAANTAVMQSRMDAAASTAASEQSSLVDAMSRLTATTAASVSTSAAATAAAVSTSAAATDSRINAQLSAAAVANVATARRLNAQLAAAAAASVVTTRALNVSVQAAIVAANNAAVPQVYVQWGAKACTAPSGVRVVKLYDGITSGSRHNYNGGGGNSMCLKNAGGAQGGHRQGGQDSNDIIIPLRVDHTNYNQLPSRNNLLRARENWIIPCAKCKYAKSCFEEAGVAECPSGYHKMYTGWLFGGHTGHSGNNNRICVDKNPANNDYTSNNWWYGVIYPTLSYDSTGSGLSRNNNYVLACHMCCVR